MVGMSDVISIVSIVFSFFTALVVMFFEVKNSKKINSINLEAHFYNQIFEKYLIEKIPITRNQINFSTDGKIKKDYKNLSKAVLELKKDILYFKFRNKEFYDNLETELLSLDEFLVCLVGCKKTSEEQKEIFLLLDKKISNIYEYIFKECF